MNISKSFASAVVTAACLSISNSWAGDVSQLDFAKKELRAAPVAEMPAKAAQLVSQAKANAEATAETVVTAAAQLRPAAIVAVVGAIARENAAVAPAAAAKAAALQPKEAVAIARAAAGAAKAQAARIVYAMCKALPGKYNVIAVAVAMVAPEASKEIVVAVTEAVPGLKPFVARASTDTKSASVASIMGMTEGLVQQVAAKANTTAENVITAPALASGAPAYVPLAPPSVGPPFTTPLGSPTEINRTSSAEVPPGGGRNYSGP